MPARKSASVWTVLAGTGLLALSSGTAHGQHHMRQQPCPQPQPVCPAPVQQLPPVTRPAEPAKPGEPAKPIVEPAPVSIMDERFGALAAETVAVAESNVGYIDSAIPRNTFRLRYDSMYNNRRPNRAEYIYGRDSFAVIVPDVPGVTTGTGTGGGGGGGATTTLNALPLGNGEALLPANLFTYETSIDIQELTAYLEVAVSNQVSIFVEAPYKFLNGDIYGNHSGLGDINFGVKAAVLNMRESVVSLQLRGYAETGVVERGLGTDHFSVEPGVLLYQQLSDRLNLEAEAKWWIPIDGTNFAGNLIRYGVGLSFDAVDTGDLRVSPVAEVVGWTVLDGRELIVHDFGARQNLEVVDADGDTIVNLKIGLRIGNDRGDIYAGYGRAITGANWYEDIYRIEFRLFY